MAFGKKKDEEPLADGESPPAKKKPILLIVIAALAVVAFVCTFAFSKKISAHSKPKVVVEEKGPILELDEFLVNLADPGSDHYLKLTVALELTKKSGKTAESMKEDMPRVRDAVLTALSNKLRDDVSSKPGREKLKLEIKDDVNKTLGADKPIVKSVMFTNFATQ